MPKASHGVAIVIRAGSFWGLKHFFEKTGQQHLVCVSLLLSVLKKGNSHGIDFF